MDYSNGFSIFYIFFIFQTNVVWVSCEGENPADVENIKARDYYPRMGFPWYYFPFKNINGYVPPIVAVQFTVESKYQRFI